MPEPLDLLQGMSPAELMALEQMGGTPNISPADIDRVLRQQGFRTGQRPGSAPQKASGPAIPMDPGVRNLMDLVYQSMTEPPEAPPSQRPSSDPFIEMLPPETIQQGVQRLVEQGTPASAMPGDLAQTGTQGAPMLPAQPPEKPSGLMSMMMGPIQQRMLMEAARRGPGPAPGGAPGATGAPGAPPPPPGTAPDPIATGAAAAQQAAAAGAAAQAQTPADPFAGLPGPLADAMREYQAIAADLKKQDDSAKWMALAKAGFAMAGSRNPSFFGALGEGGLAGLSAYEQAQSEAAARRLQAAGLDMTVGKTILDQQQAEAAGRRQAEQDALEAEYKRARIGSLNRSNRGTGGGQSQQGITQAQYLSLVQREVNNLMTSGQQAVKYRTDPGLARQDAMANVNAYLSESGITVRGMGGGGGQGSAPALQTVAGPQPGDIEDGMEFLGGDPADEANWREAE